MGREWDEEEFKENVRRAWINTPSSTLLNNLAINETLIKQVGLRNQVIREILDARKRRDDGPDRKTKQFTD